MAKLFMMSTSQVEKSVEEKLVRFFESKGIEWSHWLPNSWLLAIKTDLSPEDIYRGLSSIDIHAEMLIMEINRAARRAGALFKAKEFNTWLDGIEE